MFIAVTWILVALGQDAPKANLDIETFEKSFFAAQSSIRDFSFEYEGTLNWLGVKEPNDTRCAGRYMWHSNHLSRGEQYIQNVRDSTVTVTSFASRNREYRILQRHFDDPLQGVATRMMRYLDNSISYVADMYLSEIFLYNLADTKVTLEEEEIIDGHPCQPIHLEYAEFDGEPQGSIRFWIALDRNGHIVRSDEYYKKMLIGRKRIQLEKFPLANQTTIWMPVSVVAEQFGEWDLESALKNISKRVRTKETTSREQIRVMKNTMRVNKDIPEYRFEFDELLGEGLVTPSLRSMHSKYTSQTRADFYRKKK